MAWGGSGSGSSGWGGGTKIYLPQPKKKKDSKTGGFLPLTFTKNLVSDVVDTAVGFVPGVVETFRNPIKTGKAFAEAEWHSWSPLLKATPIGMAIRGDSDPRDELEEWGKRFLEHPLAPILDIVTIATLGAGAAGRVAYTAGNAGRIAKAATTAEGRYINPLVKARRQQTGRALDKIVGVERREKRAADRQFRRDQHQMGFNIARLMRGAERASKKGQLDAATDLRTVMTHLTEQTKSIARPGVLTVEEKAKGRIYLADLSRMGMKEFEAPDGFIFQTDKRGRHTLVQAPDVKNLYYDKDGKPAPLIASKAGAWEVTPTGTTARLHNVSNAKARKVPLDEAVPVKKVARPIKEDDGTYSLGGGYKKTLVKDELHPNKGMVWKKVSSDKFVQVPDPGLAKRKLIAGQGQQIIEKVDKKGNRVFRMANDPHDPIPPGDWTVERLTKELHGNELRGRIFTSDPTLAMKTADGLPLHVNRRIVKDYHAEAANSANFLGKMYHYPLTVWRHLILGTPRYFVNNAVGNTTMALVNNPTSMRYYVEAVKHIKGENEARAIIRDKTGSSLPWFDPLFGDMRTVKGHQVGHTAVGNIEESIREGGIVGKAERAGNAWFSWVNRVTDEPFRVAATIQRVRSDKHVKELMDKGLSEHDAVLTRAAENPEWRHAVANEVENMFGNYYAMTRTERNIRNFVPFYAWDKAITRSTKNTVLDRPGRALAMAYAGQTGHETTEKILGAMPRFLQGAIPGPFEKFLPGIGKDPGRRNVLTTSGLNPYATVADLAAGAAAVAGLGGRPSESLGQTLGPFAQTGFEVMTGTDLLSGKPLRTNPIGTLQTNLGVSVEQPGLPQLRIIKEALSPGEDTYLGKSGERSEKLYDPSLVREWYQVFGIPIKSLHVKTAQNRAKAEEKAGAL